MIKIINQPNDEAKIYKIDCDCGCKFECDISDMYEGTYGGVFVECPICGDKIWVEGVKTPNLNETNIKFPKHFYHVDEKAAKVSNEEIQSWVRESIKMVKTEGDSVCVTGSGDTVVITIDMDGDDEYYTIVAKNYWELAIPK